MIENVVSIKLPVDEELRIRRRGWARTPRGSASSPAPTGTSWRGSSSALSSPGSSGATCST